MEQKITCLVKGLEEHLSNPTWIIARTKDYPGPTGSGWHPDVCNIHHTPSPLGVKEAWILTQGRWFLEIRVNHLLGLVAFWIKFLFLAWHFVPCCVWEQHKLKLANRTGNILFPQLPFLTWTKLEFERWASDNGTSGLIKGWQRRF